MGTAARTGQDTAPIPGLEYKATTATAESGLIAADDETGVVEAIVSVTNVEDLDGDTIEPGAYAKSLTRRRPKGIFGHDWRRWASRTEEIEELPPGDPRLVEFAERAGKQWPAQAGGLYVKTRYNLKTKTGRDAYEDVKFFSETGECEWSIGYKIPRGKSVRTRLGKRRIKEVDLFEYSPVLFGAAGNLSGTVSVKEQGGGVPGPAERDEPEPQERDEPVEPGPADDPPPVEGEPGDAATAVEEEAETVVEDELARLHADAEADIDWGEVDEAAAHAPEAPETAQDGQEPPDSDDPDDDTEPEEKRAFGAAKRRDMAKRGKAMDDGAFPIENATDLENAIKAFGRAKDKAKAKAHILRHARRLGRMDLIPDAWKTATKDAGDDLETKAGVPGTADTPKDAAAVQKLKNWYVRGEGAAKIRWGQPGDFLRCVRIAEKHMRPDQAKGFCQLRHKDALGKYAGQERGKKDIADDVTDTAEVSPFTLAHLPGTLEETRDRLHEAATKALAVDGPYLVEMLGTWPDRFIATRYTLGAETKAESFEVPYSTTGTDFTLDDPVPVQVTVDVDGAEAPDDEMLPYPAMVDDVAGAVKAHLAAGMETKAGKVLSGVNATRLKTAVEQLVAVLSAAGIEIKTPNRSEDDESDAPPEEDSTAPSVRGDEAKMVVDPALMARAYRVFADAYGVVEEKHLPGRHDQSSHGRGGGRGGLPGLSGLGGQSVTRNIGGQEMVGTPEQLDLAEQGQALKGKKVMFSTENGERRGTVVDYSLYGGGNSSWKLNLMIAYRGGRYNRSFHEVRT